MAGIEGESLRVRYDLNIARSWSTGLRDTLLIYVSE